MLVVRALRSRLPNVALATLTCVGCGPKEVTWERDGIQYTKRTDDASVDESVMDELAQHRSAVFDYLGLHPPEDVKLSYHKYFDRDDLKKRSHCSPFVGGCFFAAHGVETRHRLDRHELVHAYTSYLGDKPKIIEEGLAEVLSCDQPSRQAREVAAEEAWSTSAWQATRFADVERLYRAGGAFVGHLLQTLGPEPFMRFYVSLAAGDEFATAAAKFEQVYAEPLATTWHVAMANRNADGGCVFPVECLAPLWEADALNVELRKTENAALGHSERFVIDGTTIPARTLVSDGLTMTHVLIAPPQENSWRLGTCDTTRLVDAELGRDGGGNFRADALTLGLAPGRYWFSTSTSELATRRLGATLGAPEACTALEPLTLIDGKHLLGVSRESLTALGKTRADGGSSDWSLRLDTGLQSGRVKVECSLGVRVEVCETCAYTACQVACETSKSGVARGDRATVGTDAVLRIHLQEEAGFWLRLSREHTR